MHNSTVYAVEILSLVEFIHRSGQISPLNRSNDVSPLRAILLAGDLGPVVLRQSRVKIKHSQTFLNVRLEPYRQVTCLTQIFLRVPYYDSYSQCTCKLLLRLLLSTMDLPAIEETLRGETYAIVTED